ncbi:MAG: hypothetical protein GXO21_01945, partial [Aquificae bacterium]|nr:hypothetical protein [Aquificota bacterium]
MKLDKKILFFIFFLILIIKLKDFSHFLNKKNVITGYDAFYFTRLTEELIENQYEKIDTLRDVPDFLERPFPPPLILYIGSFFSRIFPKEYVYAFLPPIFSIFFIFP